MIDDDEDKTPVETPNAKRSSGALRLNLDEAACARNGCHHRRDEHLLDSRRVAHECLVEHCACPGFVIGGPDYDTIPDTIPGSRP